MVLSRSLLRPR
jgi:hypothetical protein